MVLAPFKPILAPKFPKCPTLFMYGLKKRVLFHGQKFLSFLEKQKFNDGSYNKHIAIQGGHWCQYDQPDLMVNEINAFLKN